MQEIEEINEIDFRKLFESGNINFLIGAGASLPAIALSDVENKINTCIENNKQEEVKKLKTEFLESLYSANNNLLKIENHGNKISKNTLDTFKSYTTFLKNLIKILIERKSTTLPKRINIFTTNYDLFLEKASNELSYINFNDGFNRNISLTNEFTFDPDIFFTTLSKVSNLYEYTVQIPSMNLIKLHGSLTWKKDQGKISFRDMNSELSLKNDQDPGIVLPGIKKFHETVLTRIYYNLLRIYANELDKENTVLFVFGFSFSDEHIYDITKRALKNPTLQIILFAHSNDDRASFEKKFISYRNVLVIHKENESFSFEQLNKTLSDVLDT